MNQNQDGASDAILTAVDSKITAVRTQSLDFSFNELADMYQDEELIIDPEFQRLFRWTEGAQSRFVESLILELPVPPIFLIEREDRVYELIDGLQRFSSYLHFRGKLKDPDGQLRSPLVLSDCDIVTDLNGKALAHLPRSLDIKLKRSYVRAEILRKESDARLRYYMFKRLNTGGERLSEQEVRNATIRLLSNEFNLFITELASNADFLELTSIVAPGQRDRQYLPELVLRFFAFKNWRTGYKHDVADFLTEYMESVSDPDGDRVFDYDRERSVFERTFSILNTLSGDAGIDDRAFGSVLTGGSEPRGQFSVYHFEGIAVGIQSVIDRVDLDVGDQRERLAAALKNGKLDPEFLKKTGAGKNDAKPLRERIRFFEDKFTEAMS